MDEENEVNGNKNKLDVNISTSQSPVTEMDSSSGKTADKQDSEERKGEDKIVNVVPFFKLFSFADSKDIVLMTVGTVAALANGLTTPLMTILIGDLVNSFGQTGRNGLWRRSGLRSYNVPNLQTASDVANPPADPSGKHKLIVIF